jgi:thiol-disulfide isomerase/thioredoxin
MKHFRRLVVVALLVLAASGCDTPNPAAALKKDPVAPVPVAVREASAGDLEAALQAHKGRVVLVDCWATWCPPCVRSFPHFVGEHKKYAEYGLVCVGVSLDKRTDKAAALAFLTKHDATFPNYLFAPADERDADWFTARLGYNGAIPFKALFDKTGKRVWDSSGDDLSDRELERLIATELAK